MRVWLLVPPRPAGQILNLLPPYSLGYLATACRALGHEVEIMDCALKQWSVADVVRKTDAGRPDVLGFTLFSTDFPIVAQACREIKRLPNPPVLLLGGIHPSSYPEPTLRAIPEADFLFCGEAENGLGALMQVLSQNGLRERDPKSLSAVPGLVWHGPDGQIHNCGPENPASLDSLGLPDWSLLNPLQYQAYPPTLFVRQRPFAPIITTRGCPYLCTYCAGHNVSGYKIRARPLDLVFEEIAELRRRFGIRELHIEDDNFTFSPDRVAEFCERLLSLNAGLTWTMPNGVRLDTLSADLLRLMKRAGCYFLIVGVESGSEKILRHMRKKITVPMVEEKVRLVKEAGILAHAFFMLGYPEEGRGDIQATLDLSLRLPLIGAHFSSFRPLPGTQISKELEVRGEISGFEFSSAKSTFASVVYAPPGMTRDEIKAWQKKMLLAFYLRPRILWRYALEMLRHPGLALNLLRRAWLYLGGNERGPNQPRTDKERGRRGI